MDSNVKIHLLEAIRFMMKPLVRLLINQGVSHADFTEAMKDVYVDSAIRHFGDGKVNQSRVAILTGMTRKEVRNVIDRAIAIQENQKALSRPERVLAGWHNDIKYIGPYGFPLEIPYESRDEDEPCFTKLVKTYSGDMSPRAMLQELIRGGSVVEVDNRIKVVRRDFEPSALSPELIARLGDIGHKFFLTAAANIEKKEQGSGYFDRYVYAENGCTEEVIGEFDSYVKKTGQLYLEELDLWFSANERKNDPDAKRKETGVYVCHYVEDPSETSDLAQLLSERGIEVSSSEI